MSPARTGALVVQCALLDETGAVVDRVLLRLPARPASAVLQVVLRRALEERRRGRILSVEAPAEVAVLLAALGLDERVRLTP